VWVHAEATFSLTGMSTRTQRRLAAILAADVVGYSRLMGVDEVGTLARLNALLGELVRPAIDMRKGRIVKLMGDGLLAEFPSVVEAVECAAEIQRAMAVRETDLPADDRVCISGTVFDMADGKVELGFDSLGEQQLKNIAVPVRVYRLAGPTGSARGPASSVVFAEKTSIAVLTLENLSGDPEQDYFSDGIAEDLIAGLSRYRALFVISRNSSFTYKDKKVDTRAVGAELGVRYIVTGSLRKLADRIRVGVQLIEAGSGEQIWAERYDRQITDIFAVQDEITGAVLGALLPEIGAAEAERAQRARPDELDAWAYHHRALDHLFRYTRADNHEARRLFELAIEEDPGFAAAHAGLSFACFLAIHDDLADDPKARLDQGLASARLAVKLDPRDALAHTALGRILTMSHEHAPAIAACDAAIEINPSLAAAYFGRG
jgi:adenylate cyclase